MRFEKKEDYLEEYVKDKFYLKNRRITWKGEDIK